MLARFPMDLFGVVFGVSLILAAFPIYSILNGRYQFFISRFNEYELMYMTIEPMHGILGVLMVFAGSLITGYSLWRLIQKGDGE